ncbi:MAG: AAA family ATPase [Planctomycetota bacterium]|nr:AAA family ATPase [Planctomycetota bacterium]MDA1248602.1 AAA family ATPase [Planctomycetota bacterium]
MYEQFFQLNRRPFAATPDPACFFSTESLAENLNQLKVCVEHGQGIGILTAPAGTGKTLLCQRLLKDLGERYRSIFLGNSNFPTPRSLLQAVLYELGVEPSRNDEQELRHELRNALGEIRQDYEALVLIVDEAHLFEAAVLEEIRTLVDLAEEGHSLVRVILSGQLELEERMTDRQFDAINQRTSAHVCIEEFSIAESVGYVRHRIEWAGGKPDDVITEEGTLIIARASCGVPRCLNQLADHSLLLAFAADESPVSESTVREALEDLKQLPLHWNDVNDADRMIESCSESGSSTEADSFDEVGDEAAEEEPSAQETTPSESHVEPQSDEFAAPFAVFEFGADDSPREDDEGDTLDEAAVLAEFPASSADGSDPAGEKTHASAEVARSRNEDEFKLNGQPSRPVSEICGVVLDLSSGVCGVSEYQGRGPAKTRSNSEPDSVSDPEPAQPEQKIVESEVTEETANATSVFEFGPSDEAEPTEEPATDQMTSTTKAAPTEEEVLAEIAAAEREIAEFTAEFDRDSESTADADSVVVLDEETAAEEATEPVSSNSEIDDEVESSEIAANTPAVEFEIVSDPYSLIQEPLSAGIVWDVPPVSMTRVTLEPASAPEDESSTEESCDFEESLNAETVAETQADDDLEASQIGSEDAIFEESGEPASDELCESIMHDWFEETSETLEEQLDVVEAPDAELSLFAADPDDLELNDSPQDNVESVPVREVNPDRYIDAIIPMLGEIDDRFTSQRDRVDQPERAAVDIEAELVEMISADDADIEDEIGSAVLDLCLDTQWSLQQDRVEHREESAEPASQRGFETSPERYDVVEPEEPPSASFVERVSELSQTEPGELNSSSGGEKRRPFGQLFSDLRRRSS